MLMLLLMVPAQAFAAKSKKQIIATATGSKPKNIIFMVGDGMGLTQISAGMYANLNKLALEFFKVIGLSKTYSADNLITDSAAGATAFSCGKKTHNGAVGVDSSNRKLETIFETIKRDKQMSTGFVVTCSYTHATPACFYGHNPGRYSSEPLALDFVRSDIDVAFGGGKKFFNQRTGDSLNLIDSLTARGYSVYDDYKLADDSKSKIACFTAAGEPVPADSGRGDYTTVAIDKALNVLNRNPNGFMLLIEGSQIDWGGHANDKDYIINEMLDFNKAIQAAYDFAKADGNTLVIVTADHETGGFAINNGFLNTGSIEGAFTTKLHTGAMVPVFAFGPGSEKFSGIMENTDIYWKMRELLGL